MLQGINILGFFNNISETRYSNADIKDYIVAFENNVIPPFVLLVNSIEIAATFQVVKIDGTSIYTGNIIVRDCVDKKLLLFKGATIGSVFDCHCQIVITMGQDTYYSEVYAMVQDTSKLLKFNINSSNVMYAGIYEIPMSEINPIFSLSYNYSTIESEITEEGVEKPYGDIPIFSTVNIVRKFDINGTSQIFRYLSYLRAFCINGEIYITNNYYTNKIYLPNAQAKDSVDDSVIIDFSYREFNFLSSSNEI